MSPAKPAARRRPHGRARRRRSWAWRYRRLLFLAGLLAACTTAGLLFVLFRVPLPPPPDLSQTTFITDVDGRPLAELHGGENRVSVSLDQVPQVLRQAVVATEDRNFFRHKGIDPIGVARATWADIRRGSAAQGGSTITQQYVKNTYVGRERTLWRKLKEAVISVKLERRLEKEEILERYLNTIYFGRGAYGVQAASRAWFGLDVGQVGLREAAYLAGLIRAPESADVARAPEAAENRRHRTLVAMRNEGYITAAQLAEVERVALTDYVQPRPPAQLEATVARGDVGTQYFVEYVRRFLVEHYGEQAVYGGGLRVRTSLDLDLQASAYEAVHGVLSDGERDPAGALVALDRDGQVVAMVGGRSWGVSKVNLAVGRAGGGRGRQGGSAFKPFVLAEAVRQGYTVESALPAPAQVVIEKGDRGRDWKVRNYEDAEFGRVNLIDATRHSVNTVYAQLVTVIGPERVVELARDLGVDSPLEPVNSITLGTQDVSVLEMAEAYATFANRGVHVEPHVVLEVRNASGALIERFSPERRKVLEREQADVVNFALRQVVERGSGRGAAFGKPVAGKTGTTQNYGDAWFVGYTPSLTTAIWMGYPEGQARAMRDVHGVKVSGGTLPATIFRRFMTVATAEAEAASFATPSRFPGKVVKGSRIRFDATADETTTTTPGDGDPAATTAPERPSETSAGTTTTTTVPAPPPTAAAPTTSSPPAPTTTGPPATRPPPQSAPPTTALVAVGDG